MSKRRSWPAIMARLNDTRSGKLAIRMGSDGSAQVTRIRLLTEWNNIDVWTVGSILHIELKG